MNLFNINNGQWHVIYIRPKFEKKVFKRLMELDIKAYMPLKTVVSQWHDRKRKIEVPVLPGYIFVFCDKIAMTKVYSISGFVKFISTAGTPDTISEERMEMIVKVLNGEYEVPSQDFKTGEKVKVASGPFEGVEGILVGFKGSCRLAVRIDVVNRYVIVNVDSNDLSRVGETKHVA